MTAADILVETIRDWGVEIVLGLPGDGINGIMEALRQRQDKIRFVQVRHEESAALMSRKGTGFDWWLGNEDNLFQGKARLEISGILRGSRKRINARIKARIEQIRQSDDLAFPAYRACNHFCVSCPSGRLGNSVLRAGR
jgi:thiamine pyrophosphate-dependent enzyme